MAQSLDGLTPKGKTPSSARILNAWIAQAQAALGTAGPRLGWLVAATVVSASLQRVVDAAGSPLFLLKGGTMLQYRLPGMSRTTRDIDGLVRGDLNVFLAELDKSFAEPWGPLTLVRGEVETIDVRHRLVKPRRFDVTVLLSGVTWRRIQVEHSADEGHAGQAPEQIPSPSLAGFGLPTPDHLTSLSMRYQIAQKVHASTDPHDPPELINVRARDAVDLLLLRDLTESTGQPDLAEVRAAIEDVFTSRAVEAEATGGLPRTWPARLTVHEHWGASFETAAESAGLPTTLANAIAQVNEWLERVERA
ncbi:nucleotidyl transferase AbiEii/AbiGii toxin family protein [Cryobacterium glaciale]|uniref:nucleotidyl transferase AbiEii/AbiGii toxin family protein n=1 Tax=Cryobacterium glaciale TaxID=1259145 RepID=UPI00141AF275|nr:nucleotidyl transferase AbiEii/AbiGii toxin family protein [Cryobacterium glaciale]